MDNNFWFYVILGAVFVSSNVITYVLSVRNSGDEVDLQELVESAVYAAEQIIPGKSGAEKFAFVLNELQTITNIDDSQMAFVKILIEGAVKKLHLAESTQPLTTNVTAEGQKIADRMAAKDLG